MRSFADIFPATVVALLDSCIITATRDSPSLFGPLLAVGALGIAIFPPLSLYSYTVTFDMLDITNPAVPLYAIPILMFAVLSVVAAFFVLFDK